MRTTPLTKLVTTSVCAIVFLGLFPSAAPWLAQESIFEFTAREPANDNPADSPVPPNGGPAQSLGKSDVNGALPMVS